MVSSLDGIIAKKKTTAFRGLKRPITMKTASLKKMGKLL